jgi:hypothetical protein
MKVIKLFILLLLLSGCSDEHMKNIQIDEAIEKGLSSSYSETFCQEDEYDDNDNKVYEGKCFQYDRIVKAKKLPNNLYEITININGQDLQPYILAKGTK